MWVANVPVYCWLVKRKLLCQVPKKTINHILIYKAELRKKVNLALCVELFGKLIIAISVCRILKVNGRIPDF